MNSRPISATPFCNPCQEILVQPTRASPESKYCKNRWIVTKLCKPSRLGGTQPMALKGYKSWIYTQLVDVSRSGSTLLSLNMEICRTVWIGCRTFTSRMLGLVILPDNLSFQCELPNSASTSNCSLTLWEFRSSIVGKNTYIMSK